MSAAALGVLAAVTLARALYVQRERLRRRAAPTEGLFE